MRKFNAELTQALASELADVVTASGLSIVEMSYAVAALLRGIGEAAYDRSDISETAVLADYRTSPSFPAALIVHADQIHNIRELFLQEVKDPEVNSRAWKAHEESLIGKGAV